MGNRDTNTEVDNEVQIDLLEVLYYVWERIWLVILCTLMCGAAAYVSSNYFMTEYYKSTTTIWVMGSGENSGSITYSEIQTNTQLSNDYIQIITSRTVLEKVIKEQGLNVSTEELKKCITATKKTDTRMIDITVTDTDPLRAQAIANTIYDVVAERIVEVIKLDNLAVTRVDEASLPTSPSSPNVKKYTVLGALAGMLISIVLIVILFMLDDTIKTDEDVEKYLGFTPLASIPEMEESGKEKGKKSRNTEKKDSVKVKKKMVPSKNGQSASETDN